MTWLLEADEARRVWRSMSWQVRDEMLHRAWEGIPFPEPEWTRVALSQVRRDRRLVRRVEVAAWALSLGVWFGSFGAWVYFGGRLTDPPGWVIAVPVAAFLVIVVLGRGWTSTVLSKFGLVSGFPMDRDEDWSAELGIASLGEGRSVLRLLWRGLATSVIALMWAVLMVGWLDYEPRPVDGLARLASSGMLAVIGCGVMWLGSRGWSWLRRRWRRPES